ERARLALERARHVLTPAAREVAVDDVVVDHEGRVQELDRARGIDRGRTAAPAEGGVCVEQQARPDPLAAECDAGRRAPELRRGGSETLGAPERFAHELLKPR